MSPTPHDSYCILDTPITSLSTLANNVMPDQIHLFHLAEPLF